MEYLQLQKSKEDYELHLDIVDCNIFLSYSIGRVGHSDRNIP